MSVKRAVSITVQGKVQGVGFRYFTRSIAKRYGIAGFVRNVPDGSVYIEAEGDKMLVDKFIERVKSGPVLSKVDHITVLDRQTLYMTDFIIKK